MTFGRWNQSRKLCQSPWNNNTQDKTVCQDHISEHTGGHPIMWKESSKIVNVQRLADDYKLIFRDFSSLCSDCLVPFAYFQSDIYSFFVYCTLCLKVKVRCVGFGGICRQIDADSLVYNRMKLGFIVFSLTSTFSQEGVLFHAAHRVAPSCSYSSPEQTNQSLGICFCITRRLWSNLCH